MMSNGSMSKNGIVGGHPTVDETEEWTAAADEWSNAIPDEAHVPTSFADFVARMFEHAVALNQLTAESAALYFRNLRPGGRQDVTHLHRQLARQEDMLESVRHEVERLREELRSDLDAVRVGAARGRSSTR
jgi:hypothetical protein